VLIELSHAGNFVELLILKFLVLLSC